MPSLCIYSSLKLTRGQDLLGGILILPEVLTCIVNSESVAFIWLDAVVVPVQPVINTFGTFGINPTFIHCRKKPLGNIAGGRLPYNLRYRLFP